MSSLGIAGRCRAVHPLGPSGQEPKSLETMLWMHLLQAWILLWDEGVKDVVYDSYAM